MPIPEMTGRVSGQVNGYAPDDGFGVTRPSNWPLRCLPGVLVGAHDGTKLGPGSAVLAQANL